MSRELHTQSLGAWGPCGTQVALARPFDEQATGARSEQSLLRPLSFSHTVSTSASKVLYIMFYHRKPSVLQEWTSPWETRQYCRRKDCRQQIKNGQKHSVRCR